MFVALLIVIMLQWGARRLLALWSHTVRSCNGHATDAATPNRSSYEISEVTTPRWGRAATDRSTCRSSTCRSTGDSATSGPTTPTAFASSGRSMFSAVFSSGRRSLK